MKDIRTKKLEQKLRLVSIRAEGLEKGLRDMTAAHRKASSERDDAVAELRGIKFALEKLHLVPEK